MITEKIEKEYRYLSITNEDPALALAEATGWIAKLRKNWVLVEVIADKNPEGPQFIGVKLRAS